MLYVSLMLCAAGLVTQRPWCCGRINSSKPEKSWSTSRRQTKTCKQSFARHGRETSGCKIDLTVFVPIHRLTQTTAPHSQVDWKFATNPGGERKRSRSASRRKCSLVEAGVEKQAQRSTWRPCTSELVSLLWAPTM